MTVYLFTSLFISIIVVIIKACQLLDITEVMPMEQMNMDDVDTAQQNEINKLVKIDAKHDKQFTLLFLLMILITVWCSALTIGLIK